MNDAADPKPPRDNVTTIERAVEGVGRDLLLACLGEIRSAKKPFDEMTEKQQAKLIDRVREVVAGALRKGFAIMSTAGFPHTQATLEKVAFTVKGVQGTLSLATTSSDRHALSDHAGGQVVVILAAADRYMAKINEVQPSPDQAALPLDGPDTSGLNTERHDAGDVGTITGDGSGSALPPIDESGAGIPSTGAAIVDAHPGDLTLEVVADAMALAYDALEDVPVAATIATWTQEQRAEVVDYCAALHLKGSGHEVVVLARPAVLGGAP